MKFDRIVNWVRLLKDCGFRNDEHHNQYVVINYLSPSTLYGVLFC